MIDLRSDTMTAPTAEMLAAASRADAGDDCYGESRATRQLEDAVSEMTGKDDSVFVPSGTMSNQVALKSLVSAGNEVLCGNTYHINFFESSQTTALSQISLNPIAAPGGRLTPELLDAAVAVKARWSSTYATPQLVWLENTINSEGGGVVSVSDMKAIQAWASTNRVRVFLDGARALNAAVALIIPLRTVADSVDALTLCFAKGLGAPMGSVLAGSAEFIERARYHRKQLGGGLHQSGFAAAAALFGLTHHVERLAEDHANARRFADTLTSAHGDSILAYEVQSNMVMLDVGSASRAERLVADAEQNGVRLLHWRASHVRAVFRLGITGEESQRAAEYVSSLLAESGRLEARAAS
jgi:threonine aldolase